MIRSIALAVARKIPTPIKDLIHHNRHLDRLARRAFSLLARADSEIVHIESGPMAGLRLAISEHTSHAHISGTYELETQIAIARLVKPGFVCYDIGASIGYLSLLMARRASHVYAFEPAPHAAAEIERQATTNGFSNISIIRRPVSDQKRSVTFAITDVAYGSAIARGDTKWPTIQVETLTLDSFIKDHPAPDFIKIDVEGEEGRVLAGARELLRHKRPIICCEIHNEEAAHDVQEILSQNSYDVTDLKGNPFQLKGAIVPGELQIIALPR
ncbi:FkbM family methyltransferase [Pyrinomonas methylaliphatogenes]|uniref:Methyltransferase, FkbM family n=1 Tax=Pyrinomonas methylaliphatogenes TaxID=454194 RepID=A0A0B6WZU3_9BACT|nr:FkbM family methyltransferase [Pyrinomonas methylaliphatogenes]CDM66242.1 methyltransferase, FkbM family [Pyrinomonas methylaliphatogenes]